MRVVAALGGNAPPRRRETMLVNNQCANVRTTATPLAALMGAGHKPGDHLR